MDEDQSKEKKSNEETTTETSTSSHPTPTTYSPHTSAQNGVTNANNSPESNSPVIAGAVTSVVGVMVIALIVVLVVVCLKRKKQNKIKKGDNVIKNQHTNLDNPVYSKSDIPDNIQVTPPPQYELISDVIPHPHHSAPPSQSLPQPDSSVADYEPIGNLSSLPPKANYDYSQVQKPKPDPDELVIEDNTAYQRISPHEAQHAQVVDATHNPHRPATYELAGSVDDMNSDEYAKVNKPPTDPDDLIIQDNATYRGIHAQ